MVASPAFKPAFEHFCVFKSFPSETCCLPWHLWSAFADRIPGTDESSPPSAFQATTESIAAFLASQSQDSGKPHSTHERIDIVLLLQVSPRHVLHVPERLSNCPSFPSSRPHKRFFSFIVTWDCQSASVHGLMLFIWREIKRVLHIFTGPESSTGSDDDIQD